MKQYATPEIAESRRRPAAQQEEVGRRAGDSESSLSAQLHASPRQVAQSESLKPVSGQIGEGTVQRMAATAGTDVIQRQLAGDDAQEVEAFFLREIRAIGSPTSKPHRALRLQALAESNVIAAKQRIRDFIRRWKQSLDDELVGEQDDTEAPSDDRYNPPVGEKGPVFSNDLESVLGPHQRPVLPRENAPENVKRLNPLNYTDLKGMDRRHKLYAAANSSREHGATALELEKRANTQRLHKLGVLDHIDRLAAVVMKSPGFAAQIQRDPSLSLGGLVGVYYRYHKFGISDRSRLVFGGGFNKSDIDSDFLGPREGKDKKPLHGKAVARHFKDRHDALETLSSGAPTDKVKTLQDAQANAFSTPFIATTSTGGYAESLLREYPPADGQIAVMLTILGPSINTLDFESEFASLKVGKPEHNFRTTEKRAKDKEQAEFGIPDIYIPFGLRSPLGFVIAHIERLTK